jgi:chromosome segregation protein
LYIERLHLKGFKSFGTPQELLFSRGFTAIVGPNGSGKSNLLDALRWVLGDGGLQRLRISRQGDLLFSGSASVPPAPAAEVSVTLKRDGGGAAPSCLLRRSYTHETGAAVTVDGARARLSDLDDVKREWRLEGDQFAFIGQGEVAEAIRQRPAQRRAYLDLLFGIDRYRRKRTEASAKLQASGEESLRLEALAAELANRRDEIAPAVELASRAKVIRDGLEEKRRAYYFHRRKITEEEISSLDIEMAALEGAAASDLRWKRLWQRTGEELSAGADLLAGEIASLRDARAELARKRDEIQKNCFAAAAAVREIRSRRAPLAGEEETLLKRQGELAAERDELASREEKLLRELEAATGERDCLKARMDELRETFDREREKRQARSRALSALNAERESLQSGLAGKEAFLTGCRGRITEAGGALSALKEEIGGAAERIAALEAREKQVVEAHGEAFAASRKTAAALQQARRETAALEASAEDLKNAESSSYPEPVRFLVSAGRLGRLPVNLAVAAETFACPAQVARAMEAYLGGRQYWVFVETLADAGVCIEMLKERRAGRATFLPLEKSRPRRPDRAFRLPEGGVVGWAMDLAEPLPEWRDCVHHLLGDLLIVRDYPTGSSLAAEGVRFPLVTLEGEVFLSSGTVSGGRGRQTEGAIERRRRIGECLERLEGAKNSVASLGRMLEKEEAAERALGAEKEALALELRRERAALQEKTRDCDLAAASLERLSGEASRAEEDIKAWRERLASMAAEAEALSAPAGEDGGGEDFASLSDRFTAAENARALLAERLAAASDLKGRAAAELERTAERLGRLEREKEEIASRERGELDRLRKQGAERGVLVREGRRRDGELEALLEKEKRLEFSLSKVAGRLDRARAREAKGEERARSLGAKKESLSSELSRLVEAWDGQYPYVPSEAPSRGDGEAAAASVRRLERELKALEPVEWGALSENASLESRIAFLEDQLSDVRSAITGLRELIGETDRHVGVLFSEALEKINERFNALFQRLFGGGEARLRLQAPEAPADGEGEGEASSPAWDSGVEIVARPPGKHLQNLAQLSGGEQSLTAIAYLFASMEAAGAPLAVLDEVDAALDESNLLRFGDLAREYAFSPDRGSGIQLIVMTHRRATMERADILYGVTLAEPGLSAVVGMKAEDWTEPAGRRSALSGAAAR